MKITHVIRGEEWLPSAPLHVLLYQYLGWESDMPQFAHLPLILKPDGNGKLSKRDGDKLGFPVFPLNWIDPETGEKSSGFKERGYFPETMTNFLAMLGWSPGNNDEFFTLTDLIEKFSIARIGKAGTKFDIEKANWFNQHYLREKTMEQLSTILKKDLEKQQLAYDAAKLPEIIELLKERAVFPKDLLEQGRFFFERPKEFDDEIVSKKWNEEAAKVLAVYTDRMSNLKPFKAEDIKQLLYDTCEELGIKMGKVMQPLRLAITGSGAGVELMPLIEILGKEETIGRLEDAIEQLPKF
jgi:glutamyl-tRNA synthetase